MLVIDYKKKFLAMDGKKKGPLPGWQIGPWFLSHYSIRLTSITYI